MSNQNPLAPQGSLLEQKAKGKPYLRVAYVIVALHLLFLGGLLIQGCKRDDPTDSRNPATTNESALPPLDSTSIYGTNSSIASTNPPILDTAQPFPGAITNPGAQPVPGALTPVDTAPPAMREYVVVSRDSFSSIGKKFGVSAAAIARANPGVDSTRLKVGDKLQIPAPTPKPGGAAGTVPLTAEAGAAEVYSVKAGDTLGKIAKAHSTTVAEIKSLNGLSTDRINVGQKLKLPATRTTPLSVPAAVPAPGPGTPAQTGVPGNL